MVKPFCKVKTAAVFVQFDFVLPKDAISRRAFFTLKLSNAAEVAFQNKFTSDKDPLE